MKAYEAGVWAFLARACRNHSPNLSNRSVLRSFYMVARRAFMATSRKSNDVDVHAFHVKPKNVLLCLFVRPRYTEPHMRASPSGKASASQADIRGFESRCPLHAIQKSRESGSFSWALRGQRGSNPTGRERSWEGPVGSPTASVRARGAREAACSRSEYASPVACSRDETSTVTSRCCAFFC